MKSIFISITFLLLILSTFSCTEECFTDFEGTYSSTLSSSIDSQVSMEIRFNAENRCVLDLDETHFYLSTFDLEILADVDCNTIFIPKQTFEEAWPLPVGVKGKLTIEENHICGELEYATSINKFTRNYELDRD